MQEILGAAEEASGTQEDVKEALKVCLLRAWLTQFRSLASDTSSCMMPVITSTGPSSVFKIVKMIMERNFQPVIIFSFSKKECEAYALQVAKLDFNRGVCPCDCACCWTVPVHQVCEIKAEGNWSNGPFSQPYLDLCLKSKDLADQCYNSISSINFFQKTANLNLCFQVQNTIHLMNRIFFFLISSEVTEGNRRP